MVCTFAQNLMQKNKYEIYNIIIESSVAHHMLAAIAQSIVMFTYEYLLIFLIILLLVYL